MAPLNEAEEDAISARILKELSGTRYACTRLSRLDGGTANFVYRGILARPLPQDGSRYVGSFTATANDEAQENEVERSVIVKHSTDFVAINRDVPLDATRGTFEESMLDAVAALSPNTHTDMAIKTPRLYLFSHQTNTRVIQDFPNTRDLKSIFFSPGARTLLPGSSAATIGHHLGSWLKSFHVWASATDQAGMRTAIGQNAPMRALKRAITYDAVLPILENYPELLVDCKERLIAAIDVLGNEFSKEPRYEDEDWGIIHGDYWSGNVLVPNSPWCEPGAGSNKLAIIDWEFSQYGHRAYDLGQILGDLYERNVFNHIDIVLATMQGVIEGYGELRDDMAFRTAIHTGVQLIGWHIRRPPTEPLQAPPDVVAKGLTIGRDFILKGWERDRTFFEGGILSSLFTTR